MAKNSFAAEVTFNWIFLWRLPIQNNLKLSITKKRRNKAKYLTWNFIRRKSVKKTSMPNPVKSLGCINCYSSSNPRPVKNPSNSIRYNCKKICNWTKRPKTILENKIWHFSRWSPILLLTSFSKTLLTTERRLTEQ